MKHKSTTLLQRSEDLIYLATAVLLVVAAAGMLIVALFELSGKILEQNYVGSLLVLLDRALLVLMLAEIIYTVRRISQKKRLDAEPFFIVGIIAAIRRMLVITAESSTQINIENPKFQAAMLELVVLTVITLALAAAMRLIPRRGGERYTEQPKSEVDA